MQRAQTFLVGNMYRQPDSKIEYNDRFEELIDTVLNEDKVFILLGDINTKISQIMISKENGVTLLRL